MDGTQVYPCSASEHQIVPRRTRRGLSQVLNTFDSAASVKVEESEVPHGDARYRRLGGLKLELNRQTFEMANHFEKLFLVEWLANIA